MRALAGLLSSWTVIWVVGFSPLCGQRVSDDRWHRIEDIQGRVVEAEVLQMDESGIEIRRRVDRRVFFIPWDQVDPATKERLLPKETEDLAVAAKPHPRILPNLVYNFSFEHEDWFEPQYPLGWMKRDYLRRDFGTAAEGGFSLRADGPAEGYTFQDVELIPGEAYRATLQWVGESGVGQGVRISVGSHRGPWSGGAVEWTRYETEFIAGEDSTTVRVEFDLGEEGRFWVDSVSIEPVDGEVPQLEEPLIETAAGDHKGAVSVEIANPNSIGTIRYTLDGSDPHHYSTPYTQPFLLLGPAEVRTAVFAGGYQTSSVVSASFRILPKIGDEGVAFSPVGWGQPVDEWWSEHIRNPESPNFLDRPVGSPEPVLDVSQFRDKFPDSETAGIAEAIDSLPESGGTLWFPKSGSPYVVDRPPEILRNYYEITAAIPVFRRSNLHFRSDGATIRVTHSESEGAGHPGLFAFCSMEFADSKGFQNPVRNFYFQGLTFDGGGNGAVTALMFRHCMDILIEDCEFVNFFNPTDRYHPGLIVATSMTDNIWIRRSEFTDGKYGLYWDGVHNGGVVESVFGPNLAKSGVLLLTNNDMVHYSAGQRSCQYVVLSNNRFVGGGSDCVTSTAANVLLEQNVVEGTFRRFLNQTGRGRSNMRPFVRYNGGGFRVFDNEVDGAGTLARFQGDCAQFTRLSEFRMDNIIAGNRATRLRSILELSPRDPSRPHRKD